MEANVTPLISAVALSVSAAIITFFTLKYAVSTKKGVKKLLVTIATGAFSLIVLYMSGVLFQSGLTFVPAESFKAKFSASLFGVTALTVTLILAALLYKFLEISSGSNFWQMIARSLQTLVPILLIWHVATLALDVFYAAFEVSLFSATWLVSLIVFVLMLSAVYTANKRKGEYTSESA